MLVFLFLFHSIDMRSKWKHIVEVFWAYFMEISECYGSLSTIQQVGAFQIYISNRKHSYTVVVCWMILSRQ